MIQGNGADKVMTAVVSGQDDIGLSARADNLCQHEGAKTTP
jgi:hypothetical protein